MTANIVLIYVNKEKTKLLTRDIIEGYNVINPTWKRYRNTTTVK